MNQSSTKNVGWITRRSEKVNQSSWPKSLCRLCGFKESERLHIAVKFMIVCWVESHRREDTEHVLTRPDIFPANIFFPTIGTKSFSLHVRNQIIARKIVESKLRLLCCNNDNHHYADDRKRSEKLFPSTSLLKKGKTWEIFSQKTAFQFQLPELN